jgi:cell division cycle protein 20 (cofactor of APC complex)
MALMRSVSATSLRPSSSAVPIYPDISAKHYLRNTKITIDYSSPATLSTNSTVGALPLGLSPQGILLFSRGNRIHYKNIFTNEDIGQLCKLQESCGDLRIIECGGIDQPGIVALGTSKGFVQMWDVTSKKITASWSTKGIASMRFNGPVLTVGGLKGTIRQYDTRIKEASKMKEQVRKVTRHQARISNLSWNVDGRFLASGDDNGTVYCWDSRQSVPLDVGEFVQRRKKMQHPGAITVRSRSQYPSRL